MAFPRAVHPAAGEERQRTQRTEQGRESRRRITRLLPLSPAAGLGRSACETRDSLVPTRSLGQPDSLLCNQGAGALLGAAANVPAHGNLLFLKWRWKDKMHAVDFRPPLASFPLFLPLLNVEGVVQGLPSNSWYPGRHTCLHDASRQTLEAHCLGDWRECETFSLFSFPQRLLWGLHESVALLCLHSLFCFLSDTLLRYYIALFQISHLV